MLRLPSSLHGSCNVSFSSFSSSYALLVHSRVRWLSSSSSVKGVLEEGVTQLLKNNVENPRLEATLLLSHAMQVGLLDLLACSFCFARWCSFDVEQIPKD